MEKNTFSLSPPPWEVLLLVAHYLNPKTLAIASCVSKLWSLSMSTDHLWKPIFTSHFPSLSSLQLANASVPYSRLFAIVHSAAKLRHRNPTKLNLSPNHLVFAITISTPKERVVVAAAKATDLLAVDPHGVFQFDIDVGDDESKSVSENLEEVKVTWNVVLKGWRGVFTMMDCEGKVGFRAGGEGWFSEELPTAACCSSAAASTTVADLKMGIWGGKESSDKASEGEEGECGDFEYCRMELCWC